MLEVGSVVSIVEKCLISVLCIYIVKSEALKLKKILRKQYSFDTVL